MSMQFFHIVLQVVDQFYNRESLLCDVRCYEPLQEKIGVYHKLAGLHRGRISRFYYSDLQFLRLNISLHIFLLLLVKLFVWKGQYTLCKWSADYYFNLPTGNKPICMHCQRHLGKNTNLLHRRLLF